MRSVPGSVPVEFGCAFIHADLYEFYSIMQTLPECALTHLFSVFLSDMYTTWPALIIQAPRSTVFWVHLFLEVGQTI